MHLYLRTDYPYLEEVNTALLRLVPAGQGLRVLDVGCGRGQLGEAIRRRGHEVWGLESYPAACETAGARLDRVICADLHDRERLAEELGQEKFDVLVFSDVLEHVADPRSVLELYLPYLRSGGQVLVSVPNALVWLHRLEFMFGTFRYRDTGVMDRTHLRFFTFATARQLLESTGCTVERVDCDPYLVRGALPLIKALFRRQSQENPRALLDSPFYRVYLRLVCPVETLVAKLCPGLLAFRILLRARKL